MLNRKIISILFYRQGVEHYFPQKNDMYDMLLWIYCKLGAYVNWRGQISSLSDTESVPPKK